MPKRIRLKRPTPGTNTNGRQDVKLPDGKILLPGVVSHAIAHVEHPYLIAQRITRFANILGRENVIASTDCGFAQASPVARQHPSIAWAKLESLAEGARIEWREKVRVWKRGSPAR